MNVACPEVGAPFLQRVNGKLQDQAREASSSAARIWNAFFKN